MWLPELSTRLFHRCYRVTWQRCSGTRAKTDGARVDLLTGEVSSGPAAQAPTLDPRAGGGWRTRKDASVEDLFYISVKT